MHDDISPSWIYDFCFRYLQFNFKTSQFNVYRLYFTNWLCVVNSRFHFFRFTNLLFTFKDQLHALWPPSNELARLKVSFLTSVKLKSLIRKVETMNSCSWNVNTCRGLSCFDFSCIYVYFFDFVLSVYQSPTTSLLSGMNVFKRQKTRRSLLKLTITNESN